MSRVLTLWLDFKCINQACCCCFNSESIIYGQISYWALTNTSTFGIFKTYLLQRLYKRHTIKGELKSNAKTIKRLRPFTFGKEIRSYWRTKLKVIQKKLAQITFGMRRKIFQLNISRKWRNLFHTLWSAGKFCNKWYNNCVWVRSCKNAT